MGWRAATGWCQLFVVYYVSFFDIDLEGISRLLLLGVGVSGRTVTYSNGAGAVELLESGIFAGAVGSVVGEGGGDGGHGGLFMGVVSRGGSFGRRESVVVER